MFMMVWRSWNYFVLPPNNSDLHKYSKALETYVDTKKLLINILNIVIHNSRKVRRKKSMSDKWINKMQSICTTKCYCHK